MSNEEVKDTVKRGRGRPRATTKATENQIHVYMQTSEQLELIRAAAELEGQGIGPWSRSVLLREAKRIINSSSNSRD